jgi:alcohol dehydrogenase (NADP+)
MLSTLLTMASVASLPHDIGLGLWKSKPGEVGSAVEEAIRQGYRMLDGAAAYGNEKEVGSALANSFVAGVVKREDLYIVSKVFNTHHVWQSDRSRPAAALDKTLADLGIEQLDLYLIHWPFAFEQTDVDAIGGVRGPDGTPNPALVYTEEYIETWREMIALKQSGKVKASESARRPPSPNTRAHFLQSSQRALPSPLDSRHAVGVCNFTIEQLRRLMQEFPDHPPLVNQIELHPYLQQKELVAFCRKAGIATMAYSPLGSSDSYSGRSFPARGSGPFETPSGGTILLENEIVGQIAAARGMTPAQVLIRWSLQAGHTVLPKSVRAERIAQNLEPARNRNASMALSEEDMERLAGLDCGFRYGIGYAPGHYDCPNAPWFRSKVEL